MVHETPPSHKRKSRLFRKKPRRDLNEDCITKLHASVLSQILSLLPIKEAVRTSILSKDWKHRWTASYNVDIDQSDIPWRLPGPETFINSMNELLSSPEHLRSFRFRFWSSQFSSYMQAWIDAVLSHNVEEFLVSVRGDSVVFPSSLLNSTSLRELSLEQPIYGSYLNVNVAEKNCAPNLTRLHFYRIHIVNENPDCSTVKFNFPVLEGFTFTESKWLNVESVEISAPSLSSFILALKNDEDNDYSIEIVAPTLTSFTCYHGFPRNFVLNGSSVASVNLLSGSSSQLFKRIGLRATNVLNGFTGLEELTMSCCMAEVLRKGPPLHRHDKLRRLTLIHQSGSAKQLFTLLHAMPSLKFFSVYVDQWKYYNYRKMSVPSCIVTDLEEVLLQDFTGQGPQNKLAEFLLGTAAQLTKFTFTTSLVGYSLEKIKKVLLSLPRCSEVAIESTELEARLMMW